MQKREKNLINKMRKSNTTYSISVGKVY